VCGALVQNDGIYSTIRTLPYQHANRKLSMCGARCNKQDTELLRFSPLKLHHKHCIRGPGAHERVRRAQSMRASLSFIQALARTYHCRNPYAEAHHVLLSRALLFFKLEGLQHSHASSPPPLFGQNRWTKTNVPILVHISFSARLPPSYHIISMEPCHLRSVYVYVQFTLLGSPIPSQKK